MNARWMAVAGVCCALGLLGPGCATTRSDVTGSGDERLDDTTHGADEALPGTGSAERNAVCGAEVKEGGVVLLDARTAEPLTCVLATVLRDQAGCSQEPGGSECPTEVIARGPTSQSGRLGLSGTDPSRTRLWAVAEGFVQSAREPGPVGKGRAPEIEMVPEDGFLLKFLDAEGNYLPALTVVFRQGGEVIAQLKTNELSNVFFPARTPFAGEPVQIEAEGFVPLTLSSPAELGADGNTVTLRR